MPRFEKPSPPERTVFVKRDFFELIKSGKKTVEVRVGFPMFAKLSPGDTIFFSSGSEEKLKAEILDVYRYSSLNELLSTENLSSIAPGVDEKTFRSGASEFISEQDIQKHGLLAIEFKLIKQ